MLVIRVGSFDEINRKPEDNIKLEKFKRLIKKFSIEQGGAEIAPIATNWQFKIKAEERPVLLNNSAHLNYFLGSHNSRL